MSELMNAVANDTVAKQIIKTVEGASINLIKWQVRASQKFSEFV